MTTEILTIDAPDGLDYELRINAPPEIVWQFWVDPERMIRWMGKIATLEPRPGGSFRIDYGQGDVIAGEYLELDEPRRLTLRWAWQTDDPVHAEAGRVEIELDAADDGEATLLRLRHLGLPKPSQVSHDEGWWHFLPLLVEAAEANT